MNSNNKKTIHKYNLASASSRLISRFLDILFLFVTIIGIFFLIFEGESINNYSSWKLGTFSLVVVALLQIFFIFIPFLSGGYSLFSWIFKIRIYSTNLKFLSTKKWLKKIDFVFLKQIFIREILTIEIFSFTLFFFGIMAFAVPNEIRNYLKNFLNQSQTLNSNYVEIIFSTLFSFSILINILIIINVILFSGKRTFTDHISNTVVIKMVDVSGGKDINSNLNYKNKKVKYNLPGEVDVSEIMNEE